eukprot:768757-Hanusia_phi.AAC.4
MEAINLTPGARKGRAQEGVYEEDWTESSAKKRKVQSCMDRESINSFMQTIGSKNSERCRESAMQHTMFDENKENKLKEHDKKQQHPKEEAEELHRTELNMAEQPHSSAAAEESEMLAGLKIVMEENKLMRNELKTMRSSFVQLGVELGKEKL